jgi:hypothetical protein
VKNRSCHGGRQTGNGSVALFSSEPLEALDSWNIIP